MELLLRFGYQFIDIMKSLLFAAICHRFLALVITIQLFLNFVVADFLFIFSGGRNKGQFWEIQTFVLGTLFAGRCRRGFHSRIRLNKY